MHCKNYSHFFSKKFKYICVSLDVNFNETLTNDGVSFEQLGPGLSRIRDKYGFHFLWFEQCGFVSVEILRPSQPNGVMSSAVSLPNHTFTGQAKSSKRLTSIVHILSPETDNCPSWISGRERMTVENISWSISTKECWAMWVNTRKSLIKWISKIHIKVANGNKKKMHKRQNAKLGTITVFGRADTMYAYFQVAKSWLLVVGFQQFL